jgi:hypothetical protein
MPKYDMKFVKVQNTNIPPGTRLRCYSTQYKSLYQPGDQGTVVLLGKTKQIKLDKPNEGIEYWHGNNACWESVDPELKLEWE